MKDNYIHTPMPEFTSALNKEGEVVVDNYENRSYSYITDITLMTYKIAQKISIKPAGAFHPDLLPYDAGNDNTMFDAPICSAVLNRQITFMRGWKRFESCIKGFNALGLMSEQVLNTMESFKSMSASDYLNLVREYLISRKTHQGEAIFNQELLQSVGADQLARIDHLDIAIWKTFARKTIVCSTSSNMGISLHDALREMQKTNMQFAGKSYTLLNHDEGSLIIWCPDEEADFMNHEKTAFLRRLESEEPALTRLRTYINRQQRDPGALRDALILGGYFFPTNPQSADEIQNLLFFALKELAEERKQSIAELTKDENIRYTLTSLKCHIQDSRVFVRDGVEGGISGLMLPYFLMVEELVSAGKLKAVSTWNQASIGAALAAAIIADKVLRNPRLLNEKTRSELYSLFPNISRLLDSKSWGKDIKTRIHGIFDLANIQSLAQLLGVVVQRHLSGRGTAYVGLGSSSYSNGNRCYEILKDSFESEESFRGKSTFHPATHTLNPFAQALVYGEDLYRCTQFGSGKDLKGDERVSYVLGHVRKPEPAGAAAMAGYLLSRLDSGTFSIVELAYQLRLLGFNRKRFLQFANHTADEAGYNLFLQESSEEGVYMGNLARNVLTFLEWPLGELEEKARLEHEHSKLKYNIYPLDDQIVDTLNPRVNIYLTGDNTFQPDAAFASVLMQEQESHISKIAALIQRYKKDLDSGEQENRIVRTTALFSRISAGLKNTDRKVNELMKRTVNRMVNNRVNKITK
ncbi:MAG: hypothetical protein JNL57_00965 [Bacteroidetes bacterium]|nr:hypothetical protein [Bacteroidota bacterium]